jgi:hypothetical protein
MFALVLDVRDAVSVLFGESAQYVARSVGRSVIHDDQVQSGGERAPHAETRATDSATR